MCGMAHAFLLFALEIHFNLLCRRGVSIQQPRQLSLLLSLSHLLREARSLNKVADGELDVTLDGIPHDGVRGLDINMSAAEMGKGKG